MPTRVLALAAFILLAAYISGGITFQSMTTRTFAQAQVTPSPTPRPWPDLDILKDPLCTIDGAAAPNTDKADRNRLMNRYRLPEKPFEELTLEYLQGPDLPQGETSPGGQFINLPTWKDPNNQRAITVIGYVTKVQLKGCGTNKVYGFFQPPETPGAQSANCYVNKPKLCTAQIVVTPDPSLSRKKGRNTYFIKVTRRSRWLLRYGHLESNGLKDWSTETLRKRIKRRWVRFSGWLFFNENYRDRAWVSDPENKNGKANDRQTAWEIHPVMGIELIEPPLKQADGRKVNKKH